MVGTAFDDEVARLQPDFLAVDQEDDFAGQDENIGHPRRSVEPNPILDSGDFWSVAMKQRLAPGDVVQALDAATGDVLWEVNLGSPVTGYPITLAVNGRQYVAARHRQRGQLGDLPSPDT